MVWNDGMTLLTLQHESSGHITVTLEDFAAMSKYSNRLELRCLNFEFAGSHPHIRNSDIHVGINFQHARSIRTANILTQPRFTAVGRIFTI
jgi:hypothetical protein